MNKQILVVDDSNVLRASVRFALEGSGLDVVEAENGRDGLSELEKMAESGSRPLMILTDINMPVMDGITFIKKVKKTPMKFVPILVLTTENQDMKKLEGEKVGASDWLVKPFREDQLINVIKKYLI